MAWKGDPTNKTPTPEKTEMSDAVGREKENRALHIRRDVDDQKNFTVTIKDIDETVFKHLEKMELSVVDNGNKIRVPVFYASPEKWKSVRHDGFMRDTNGRVILPALIFYRQSSESDQNMMMFNKYLRYSVMKKYSQKNQYTKFSTLVNQNVPVNEIYNVVMPDHMNFNYKFVVWTESVEQNNSLIERINFETNDYWGEEEGFRFRTFVNSYSHTTEVASDSDRMVKTEFDLVLRGYLLPDSFSPGLDGFKSTTEKTFTAKKVIIGTEIVGSGWKPTENKTIKDKWRSQNFHNLTLEDELSLKGIGVKVLKTEDLEHFRTSIRTITNTPITEWHLPPPTSSDDPGQEGWQSYDNDYYYLYAGGIWKRVPLVLFNRFGD